MRVLLLNPAFDAPKNAGIGLSFPLGLGYLATSLKKAGIDVIGLDAAIESPPIETKKGVIHYGLNSNALRKRIEAIRPDVIGISCFFSSRFPAVLEAAKIAKSINPGIITITGGVHPTLVPEKVGTYPEIDYAVMGEGEATLVALIESLDAGKDLSHLGGLAYKGDGQVMVNPKICFADDLDSLGSPDWELFQLERYLDLHEKRWGLGEGRYAPIVTSRGCPYHCTFCSIHKVMGARHRVHSPAHVVDEIQDLVSRYGVDEISFEDDNLTYDIKRFVEICKAMIDRGLKIRWNTPNGVHVGSLDDEALHWAALSGCDSLNLAIESGDEYIRNHVIKKGLRENKIYEAAYGCHRHGIKPNAYFVIGMPGEKDSSINNTKKYIRELDFNNLSIFVATPAPGTKFYDDCVERGYIQSELYDNEFVNFNAAIFTQPSIETPEFDREKIELWRYRLIMAYYRSRLRKYFFDLMLDTPKAWASMIAKVFLYSLLGESISYKLIRRLKR